MMRKERGRERGRQRGVRETGSWRKKVWKEKGKD